MEELRNEEIEAKGFEIDEQEEVVETKKTVLDKIKGLGSAATEKFKDVANYVKEHPDEAAEKAAKGLAAGAVGLLTLVTISSVKEAERTTYSEDIGETVRLKKKLTNKDKVELDYRMKTGQTKIEALDDMSLIKK